MESSSSDLKAIFGAKGGLRATDQVYDLMIEEDCKAGDHSNALEIAYEMEAAGRMATTFHFNQLLSVQIRSNIEAIGNMEVTFESRAFNSWADNLAKMASNSQREMLIWGSS
ncbi:hypothetical protein Dsin_021298 [Dipteronia sinensis]|uniref:Uncharacterized protein n=1 Tax=Dipteronia sinensis TaxID=43782 RepID=A0AAD9ZZG5_9ROSI|nr:hypothetical protein Dsin_021298 [Dipteronia sinensis]